MNIIVCSLARAPGLAADHQPSHAISLLDPGTPFPALGLQAARHLQTGVHDIEEPEHGYEACCDQRMRALLDFAGGWDRTDPLLVHCYAGISRSTATAFIAACLHNPHVDEEEIALALRKASHTASPNRRFVALADAALERSGRMSRAIEAIGRGPSWLDIGEANPFVLQGRFG